MAAWYETEKGWNRMLLERELLDKDFPQMEMGETVNKEIVVRGYIGPGDRLSEAYYVEAVYPYNYGNGNDIQVYVPDEDFPSSTPHMYPPLSERHICIHNGDWDRNCTISDALGWARGWLELYEEFRRTGARW